MSTFRKCYSGLTLMRMIHLINSTVFILPLPASFLIVSWGGGISPRDFCAPCLRVSVDCTRRKSCFLFVSPRSCCRGSITASSCGFNVSLLHAPWGASNEQNVSVDEEASKATDPETQKSQPSKNHECLRLTIELPISCRAAKGRRGKRRGLHTYKWSLASRSARDAAWAKRFDAFEVRSWVKVPSKNDGVPAFDDQASDPAELRGKKTRPKPHIDIISGHTHNGPPLPLHVSRTRDRVFQIRSPQDSS